MTQARELFYTELIVNLESRILIAIGFDVEVELAFEHIAAFFSRNIVATDKKLLMQTVAIGFCNDSFKLPVCLYHHPKVIAAGCIAMSA